MSDEIKSDIGELDNDLATQLRNWAKDGLATFDQARVLSIAADKLDRMQMEIDALETWKELNC